MCRLIIIILISFNWADAFLQDDIPENGPVQFYYPSGQISSAGYMREGKPDGYWITYYATGIKKSEVTTQFIPNESVADIDKF